MSVEEKVGQMIQPDFREVTPEEVTRYKIGSVLNGGGGWPGNNKHASAQDWAHQADTYWQAAEAGFEGSGYRIPFMWATDAVHGHNNVFAATLFPHNIGLGAARDPDLIRRIGEATALEVAEYCGNSGSTSRAGRASLSAMSRPRSTRWSMSISTATKSAACSS